MNLTHLDENHHPKMVDVGGKGATRREAIASGKIKMSQEAFDAIENQAVKKGPVLQTAIIAAIMGGKKTGELIPMCHPIMLDGIDCEVETLPEMPGFELQVTVKTTGETGVEMEALTAVSIGLLTIYDMVKAIDKGMEMHDIRLLRKSGGKSGDFQRPE